MIFTEKYLHHLFFCNNLKSVSKRLSSRNGTSSAMVKFADKFSFADGNNLVTADTDLF